MDCSTFAIRYALETQKVMKTGGVLLQQGVHYNPDGRTELVITHNKGAYQVSVLERGPQESSMERIFEVLPQTCPAHIGSLGLNPTDHESRVEL